MDELEGHPHDYYTIPLVLMWLPVKKKRKILLIGINLNQKSSHAPLGERHEYFSGFPVKADQHRAGKTDPRFTKDYNIRRNLDIFPAMTCYIAIDLFGGTVTDDEPVPKVVDAAEHHRQGPCAVHGNGNCIHISIAGVSKKKHGLVVIRTRDLRRVKATS
jgi:hypothetical protein